MLYKKLKELGLITIDKNENASIPDIEKFEDYFKKKDEKGKKL